MKKLVDERGECLHVVHCTGRIHVVVSESFACYYCNIHETNISAEVCAGHLEEDDWSKMTRKQISEFNKTFDMPMIEWAVENVGQQVEIDDHALPHRPVGVRRCECNPSHFWKIKDIYEDDACPRCRSVCTCEGCIECSCTRWREGAECTTTKCKCWRDCCSG